ncbi:MAG: TRAP transporter small permease [Spirochaeta sp.]|jgi:TRAP-type C4-dicarboxylate transport system permease small subunit|nr:TRAP transporter small permease [Spirochaeta sp.]
MYALGRGLVWIFDRLFALAIVIAQVLLVGMVLLITANVFMRYVLNSGIFWAEEISLVMAVWFSFIAMALGVRKNLHISIHLFRNPPAWLDKALNVLKALSELLLGYVLLRYGVILVQFTSRSIMPATELPSSVLYLILPFAAVLIIYEATTDLLGHDTDAGAQEADFGEESFDA